MSRDEHNKNAKVENLIWEIAQTINPNLIIEKSRIEEAKSNMFRIFEKNQ